MMNRFFSLLVLAAFLVPMLQQSFGTTANAAAMHMAWEEQHLAPDHHHSDREGASQKRGHIAPGLPMGLMDLIQDLLHLDSLHAENNSPVSADSIGDGSFLVAILWLGWVIAIELRRQPPRLFHRRRRQPACPIWLTTGRLRI